MRLYVRDCGLDVALGNPGSLRDMEEEVKSIALIFWGMSLIVLLGTKLE